MQTTCRFGGVLLSDTCLSRGGWPQRSWAALSPSRRRRGFRRRDNDRYGLCRLRRATKRRDVCDGETTGNESSGDVPGRGGCLREASGTKRQEVRRSCRRGDASAPLVFKRVRRRTVSSAVFLEARYLYGSESNGRRRCCGPAHLTSDRITAIITSLEHESIRSSDSFRVEENDPMN